MLQALCRGAWPPFCASRPAPERPPRAPPLNSPTPQNELEAWNGTTRNKVDSFVPQQDLVDSYLPSFQTCVEEGKVSGVMVRAGAFRARRAGAHCSRPRLRPIHPPAQCSYNAVNGVPSCANEWLLKTLLRESWQFDGYGA